ncbi:MAG: hypothetical protein Kow0025_02720 [Thermodesulfovibrionales bacterium]
MKGSRIVIVGLGQIGRELIGKLSRDFDITCITRDLDAAEVLEELKRKDAALVVGDATSRLVLEDAGVNDAQGVAVTTRDERVNVEICRVLTQHFTPERVISVALTQKGMEDLKAMGVEVINIFATSAMGIRNMIEQRTKTAHAIGLGKDEIMEVEVHPNSKLAGKPLGTIDPVNWRLGIIYREGNVVVPRPDTVIRPKDRVVILGEPGVLKTVAEILTFSFEKFPLEYGSTMVVYLGGKNEEKYLDEINYLFSSFPLEKAVVVHPPGKKDEELRKALAVKDLTMMESDRPALDAIQEALAGFGGEPAFIVVPDRAVHSALPLAAATGKRAAMRSAVSAGRCPILVARGTFPYGKVALPCLVETDVERVMQTAFEISWALNSEITALAVKPGKYIAGEEETEAFEERKKTVSSMKVMYKAKVETRVLEGNPVKAVVEALSGYNLFVTDMTGGGGWLRSLLNPDVLWDIARKAPVSALVIPPVEEAL